MKILVIDNYDSFIYNLVYELESLGEKYLRSKSLETNSLEDNSLEDNSLGTKPLDCDITVCRNDIDYKALASLIEKHDAIVLSPGPGSPSDAGHCLQLIKDFSERKPILGICLGHQLIVEAFGGKVSHAKKVMHGKTSKLSFDEHRLFTGISSETLIARYHSLAAINIPEQLKAIAYSDDEVMAVMHKKLPCFGIQFHPESIMTKDGAVLIANFIEMAKQFLEEQKLIKNQAQGAEYVANA